MSNTRHESEIGRDGTWRRRLRIGCAVCAALAAACELRIVEPPPQQIRIAAGGRVGLFGPMGRALAEIYNSRLPNVIASSLETSGSLENIRAVEEGRAELAFAQADIAYSAFVSGTLEQPRPHGKLRAVAKLYRNAVQIVVPAKSGVTRVSDLPQTAMIGAPESGAEFAVAALILRAYGLDDQLIPGRFGSSGVVSLLRNGQIDAAILISRYPLPQLAELDQAHPIQLLALDASVVSRLRAEHPFIRQMAIPAGTYLAQREAVETAAVDTLLICSAGLNTELVTQLTRLLIQSATQLTATISGATVDVEDAFAAPIPLHAGATRYYRERELFR